MLSEKLRLKKIVKTIDEGKSGYTSMMKDMFNSTADLYFENIRPLSPKSVRKGNKKWNTSFHNKLIGQDQDISKLVMLHGKDKPHELQENQVQSKRNFKINRKKKSKSQTSIKPSSTYANDTYNTRLKNATTHTSQIKKYQYYKEKRLLEFLQNPYKKRTEQQKMIEKRLEALKSLNKDYDLEQAQLMSCLNEFNPLDIKKSIESTQTSKKGEKQINVICTKKKSHGLISGRSKRLNYRGALDKNKRITKNSDFFEVRRNTLKPLHKRRVYKEDRRQIEGVPKRRASDRLNKLNKKKEEGRQRKGLMQEQEMSDDSSDLSFSEVKLGQYYSQSIAYQKNLIEASQKVKKNEKLAGCLVNLVHIDQIKQQISKIHETKFNQKV